MTIYQVNNEFYQNWDQAYLNAEKLGIKPTAHELIEMDFEPEVDKTDDKITIQFENGQEFELYIELELNEQEGVYELCDLSIVLGEGKFLKLSDGFTNFKNNLTPDLLKEIHYAVERYIDYKNENITFTPIFDIMDRRV